MEFLFADEGAALFADALSEALSHVDVIDGLFLDCHTSDRPKLVRLILVHQLNGL
jgi:hypothetical protein